MDFAKEDRHLQRIQSKKFLIQNSVKEEYITKLISKIKSLKVGYPSEEETDIGCLVSQQCAIEVESQVNKILEQGGKLVYGGRRNGAFYEPTVIELIPNDTDIFYDTEIFGPVISIIGFNTIEEAIEITNQPNTIQYASIITNDINKAINTSEQIKCSNFIINGSNHFKYSIIRTDILRKMTKSKTIILKNITK